MYFANHLVHGLLEPQFTTRRAPLVREQSSIVRPLVVRNDIRLREGAAIVRLSIVRLSMHNTHCAQWAMRLSIVRLSRL